MICLLVLVLHVAEPPLGAVCAGTSQDRGSSCLQVCISDIIVEGERPLQKADLGYVGSFGHDNFLPEVGRGPDPWKPPVFSHHRPIQLGHLYVSDTELFSGITWRLVITLYCLISHNLSYVLNLKKKLFRQHLRFGNGVYSTNWITAFIASLLWVLKKYRTQCNI